MLLRSLLAAALSGLAGAASLRRAPEGDVAVSAEALRAAGGVMFGAKAQSDSAAAARAAAAAQADQGLEPPMILLMSSSLERKISYAQMANYEAIGSYVRPLVDAGLTDPRGIAYHANTNSLFVADYGKHTIFRYGLEVRHCPAPDPSESIPRVVCGGLEYEVVVKEVQRPIVTDALSQWVFVDAAGTLYFTDEKRNSVNKVEADIVRRLVNGYTRASELERLPVQEVAAAAMTGHQLGRAAILALYQGDLSGNVKVPAGVVAEGTNVFWANGEDGSTYGSLATGALWSHDAALSGSLAEPVDELKTHPLASLAGKSCGVAASNSMVLFSTETRSIYGVCHEDGRATELSGAFAAPRGLAWDGDGTVYVADHGANAVFSLPTGRCAQDLPVRPTLDLHGVFGLAVIKSSDPAFSAALAADRARAPLATSSSWVNWLFGLRGL